MVDIPRRERLLPARGVLKRPPTEREELAEQLAARLDIPFTALGILAVVVFIAERLSPTSGALAAVFLVLELVIAAALLAEFVLRKIIAPDAWRFLLRNWWQLIFIVLPFLRVLRAFSRSARIARLATVTATVILASSELLYEYAPTTTYPDALHDAALAAFGGEPIGQERLVPQSLEVVPVLYYTVVVAPWPVRSAHSP